MEFLIRRPYSNCDLLKKYPILEKFNIRKEVIKNRDNFYIHINTLEELLKLQELVKHELILGESLFDEKLEILIYDDYIE